TGPRAPEPAGRDDVIESAAIGLDRIRARRSARSMIFYGLRGVGKTVLLNHVRLDAEARGLQRVRSAGREERSLPALLVPALRAGLLRLRTGSGVRAKVERAIRALA